MDAWPVVAGVLAGAAAFGGVMTITAGGDAPDRATVAGTQAPAATSEGRRVFVRFGCGSCHTLSAARTHGRIGPNLDETLSRYDRESLTAKIVNPYPDLAPGVMATMPEDFGKRMTRPELDALVTFLLAARGRGADRSER